MRSSLARARSRATRCALIDFLRGCAGLPALVILVLVIGVYSGRIRRAMPCMQVCVPPRVAAALAPPSRWHPPLTARGADDNDGTEGAVSAPADTGNGFYDITRVNTLVSCHLPVAMQSFVRHDLCRAHARSRAGLGDTHVCVHGGALSSAVCAVYTARHSTHSLYTPLCATLLLVLFWISRANPYVSACDSRTTHAHASHVYSTSAVTRGRLPTAAGSDNTTEFTHT